MMDLSFVIVNYKTSNLVEAAIVSIKRVIKSYTYEIIIVDNSTGEDHIEDVINTHKDVQLISMENNVGFGQANNAGASLAKGEYLFLLNSDAFLIEERSISLLLEELKKSTKTAVVGPDFIYEDRSKNVSYGHFLSLKKIYVDLGFRKLSKNKYKEIATSLKCEFTKPTVVDYLGAAGIILKKKVVDEIGLFDPNYFLYFEDMDLGWNMVCSGYQSVIVPDAKIVHLGGKSTSKAYNSELDRKIKFSKNYFLRKRYGFFISIFVKTLSFVVFKTKKIKKRMINFFN